MIVEALLALGADANAKNLQQNTPLHQSVSRPSSGSEKERILVRTVVDKLLSAVGAKVLASGLPVNKQLDSVLVKAVHQGNMEGAQAIVEFMIALVQKGEINATQLKALLNQPNDRGLTPLHEACVWAKADIISYLLSSKAPAEDGKGEPISLFDLSGVDKEGNTVLHMAGDRRLAGITTSSLEHVELLLSSVDCPLNVTNKAGDSPLHIPHISVEFLDALLLKGADVTLRNNKEESVLSVQIKGGRSHVVERLLHHMTSTLKLDMAPYNTELLAGRDSHGNTVAHMLAEVNSELFATLPSELHAIPNGAGESPLELAINEKALQVITPLLKTATEGQLEAVKDERDSQGDSLLHHAANMNDAEAITVLLDFAKMDVNTPNEEMDEFTDGGLPIHLAAHNGCMDVLNLLIERGAAVESQQNPAQDTPLHLAVRFNQYDAVQALMAAGASKDIKNREGVSPALEIRSFRGHDERIRKLLLPDEIA